MKRKKEEERNYLLTPLFVSSSPAELLAALGFEVKVSTTSSNCGDNKEGDTSGGSPAKSSKAALAEKGKKSGGDSVEAESPPVVSANGPSVEVGSAKKAKGAKKEKVEKTVTQKLESAEDKEESGSDGARPKDQLIYLSKIIGFKVSCLRLSLNYN